MMQHVFVGFQYEKASSYNNLIYLIWVFGCRGRRPVCSPLHASEHAFASTNYSASIFL